VAQDAAALRLVPGNRDRRMKLALAYYKGQKITEATEQSAFLLQEDPKIARVAMLLGDCYGATRLLFVNTLCGLVREYSGDLGGAQEAFRRAIAQKPDDFEAHLRLGSGLYQLRKLDEAQTQLELALQIDVAASWARFELAKVQKAQGQAQVALKNVEAVALAIPEWLPRHVELAALYFKLKRPEDGAREKQIVDRITEEECLTKTKSGVISPQLPSR
jgi:tetratricopeptide (TPR) repeat protein